MVQDCAAGRFRGTDKMGPQNIIMSKRIIKILMPIPTNKKSGYQQVSEMSDFTFSHVFLGE